MDSYIFNEVLSLFQTIFGNEISWVVNATEIVAFVYTLFIILLYTILPTILLLSLATFFIDKRNIRRKKRRW